MAKVNKRVKQKNTETIPVKRINKINSPNSIAVKIGGVRYKALLDTGAEVSIISSKLYNALPSKPTLYQKKMKLLAANGTSLKVEGVIQLELQVGSQCVSQECVVIKDLNRLMLLGRDWLRSYGVRLYFDLGAIRINGEFIAMEEDIHISAIVKLAEDVTLKPQHIHLCIIEPKRKKKTRTGI